MADFEVIQHYLVEIGFDVDQPELQRVVAEIKEVFDKLEELAPPVIKAFLGVTGTIIAGFAAVAAGVVTMMHNVAESELGFQKYALRMNMSLDVAKRTKISLDALGATLADVYWNKEIQASFIEFDKAQRIMQAELGENYQQNMKNIRDIDTEITKFFKVEIPYFQMALTSALEEAFGLGEGGLLRKIREFNDAFMHGMNLKDPNSFVNQLAKVVKPILIDVGNALYYLTSEFIKFAGYISDDQRLKTGHVTIRNIGLAFEAMVKSIPKVVEFMKELISPIVTIVQLLMPLLNWMGAHPVLAAGMLGAAFGYKVGGPLGAAIFGVAAMQAANTQDLNSQLTPKQKADFEAEDTKRANNLRALFGMEPEEPEKATATPEEQAQPGKALKPGQLDIDEDLGEQWKAWKDEEREKDKKLLEDQKAASADARREERKDLEERRKLLTGQQDKKSQDELRSLERYERYGPPPSSFKPADTSSVVPPSSPVQPTGDSTAQLYKKYNLSSSPVMSGGLSGSSLSEWASSAGDWLSQHAGLITSAKNMMGKVENWTKDNVVKAVIAAANKYGVPTGIALGVAKTESNFNPNATSRAGAHGVMQLMPGTARQLGANINDPEQNIDAGVRYLAQLHSQFRDWHLALMAYNWGPGSVQRLVQGRGGMEPAETRAYTQRVENLATIGAINVHAAAGQNEQEIANHIVKLIEERLNRKTQRNLFQLGGGVYG